MKTIIFMTNALSISKFVFKLFYQIIFSAIVFSLSSSSFVQTRFVLLFGGLTLHLPHYLPYVDAIVVANGDNAFSSVYIRTSCTYYTYILMPGCTCEWFWSELLSLFVITKYYATSVLLWVCDATKEKKLWQREKMWF